MVLTLTHKVNSGVSINLGTKVIHIIVKKLDLRRKSAKAILEIRGVPGLTEVVLKRFASQKIINGLDVMISENQPYNSPGQIRIGYDVKSDYHLDRRDYSQINLDKVRKKPH